MRIQGKYGGYLAIGDEKLADVIKNDKIKIIKRKIYAEKGENTMIQIRPVSDLRNKFPEIEMLVNEGQPVYLTKNGYGAMVVLSLEKYASLVDNVEMKLDEADKIAETTEERVSHDDVFRNVRSVIHGK